MTIMHNLEKGMFSEVSKLGRLGIHLFSESNYNARTFRMYPSESLRLRVSEDKNFLFVLAGEVMVRDFKQGARLLTLHSSINKPYTFSPHASYYEVIASKSTLLCHVGSEGLETLVSLCELSADAGDYDLQVMQRLEQMHRSNAFKRLAAESVMEAVKRMHPMRVDAGSEVVTQGEPGDRFYYIESGYAEVWQVGLYDDSPQLVSTLGPGDSFGEEALVTDGTSSATVKMVQSGVLYYLEGRDFKELVSNQMVKEVDISIAKTMLDSGYGLIDVRYQEEYEEGSIDGAKLIPVHELRERMSELDDNRPYVVYCRSGKRSAVAALLLTQQGYDAVSLQGGINAWENNFRNAVTS